MQFGPRLAASSLYAKLSKPAAVCSCSIITPGVDGPLLKTQNWLWLGPRLLSPSCLRPVSFCSVIQRENSSCVKLLTASCYITVDSVWLKSDSHKCCHLIIVKIYNHVSWKRSHRSPVKSLHHFLYRVLQDAESRSGILLLISISSSVITRSERVSQFQNHKRRSAETWGPVPESTHRETKHLKTASVMMQLIQEFIQLK